jgi:1-acyl-sn-glycerol-3-phosphate acyltransferase
MRFSALQPLSRGCGYCSPHVSSAHIVILCIFTVLVLIAVPLVVLPALRSGPAGSIRVTLLWRFLQFYLRVVHRVRYFGLEHVPPGNADRPLIVVANHTAGIDPLLIQCGCRFKIRWMMAVESMAGVLGWFWRLMEVIPVQRSGRDTGPTREVIRHVRSGKTAGIFPEGGIVKPPGEVRPFMRGIGLVVQRAGAPVLLVWVHGTPESERTFGSLWIPSHARVHYLGIFDFSRERDPDAITEELRRRIAQASGWPLNETPVPTARKNAPASQREPSE